MFGKKNPSNYYAGYRKNQNKKRQATSPLNDNGSKSASVGENLNNNREQKKKSRKECATGKNSNTQPNEIGSSHGYLFTNMAFQSQQSGFQPQQPGFQPQQPGFGVMSQPSFIQDSPPAQLSGSAFGFQPSPAPPPWASELLEEMKQIKAKLHTIEEIKKTVNSINVKVTDLEGKMKSLEIRVTDTEKSCQFVEKEYETNKKDLKTTKDDIQNLKKSCDSFEKTSKSLKEKSAELDKKLVDLAARSMRENLMF